MSLGGKRSDWGRTRVNRLLRLPIGSRSRRDRRHQAHRQDRSLHLAESSESSAIDTRGVPSIGEPIRDHTDPRWILALRTADQLEGTILTLHRREKLVRLGRLMGLTPFDTNLVIAIVQDQARRGTLPQQCPQASEPQLAMVPMPQAKRHSTPTRSALVTAAMVACVVVLEVVAVVIYLR